ncbi:unnamed protein product (macronuclear) [Paramecium tetraurelia]|uniref:Uncharacterized protein n=1 Tax=Paramecium tetraurelia TaxID=5888 RepID=A0ED40_PARTE|nr:uncharacterized protein GSPATT00004076001 [Paramecium tetraurelia]CAK93207.1 unnamed protein product [Paramecium tetraurelia]|eukprot:XP_001460604.1 hypothetical protein (macronuclear) [Paramecium tetraurelia strain d4-2]
MVSAYSIGTGKRDNPIKNLVPAPNAYSLKNHSTSPQWTIGGKVRREIRIKSCTPGPGQYPQKSLMNGTPCCTFKGRLKQKVISQSPGPGNYKEDSFFTIQKRIPSYSIGVKIDKRIKNFGPGPGTYDLSQTRLTTNSSKFPIEKRIKTMDDGASSPGPGCMLSQLFQNTIQQTLINFHCINHNPHGDLDRKTILKCINHWTQVPLVLECTNQKPKLKTQECDRSIPGPGKYSPDVSFIKSTQPVFKIGKESRITQKKVSQGPGPGRYYSEQAKYLFLLRNYDARSKKRQPCYSLGKANRISMTDNESQFVPGPGAYDSPPQKLGNITIKGAKAQMQSQKIPGPGTYNPKDTLCYFYDGSVKFVKESKQVKTLSTETLPGPGNYDSKSILIGPCWGFGKSNSRKPIYNINNSPGPGAYNVPSKFADVPKYLNCKPKFQV